jgi:large subunit ribosomal protein L19e
MQITNQKKMAARILKCGVNRIWIDPRYIDQISGAVQKDDIREFIEDGLIKSKPIQGTSRVRARKLALQRAKGRRRGHGSRKGSARARLPKKNRWMRTIRSQRRILKGMREDGTLEASKYRYYYRKAKGGSYRSIAHMKANMEIDGIKLGGDE